MYHYSNDNNTITFDRQQPKTLYTTAGCGPVSKSTDPMKQRIYYSDKVFELLIGWFKNALMIFGITSVLSLSIWVVYMLLVWIGVV